MRTKYRDQYIFFGFLAFFLLQAVVGLGLKKTIFPSLIFPGFSTSVKFDSDIKINALHLYAIDDKQQKILLDKDSFFSNIYYKYVNFLVKTIVINEAGKPRYKITPQEKQDFLNYAQSQLKNLYPDRKFTGLLIVEGKKLYNYKNDAVSKDIINSNETYVWFKQHTK